MERCKYMPGEIATTCEFSMSQQTMNKQTELLADQELDEILTGDMIYRSVPYEEVDEYAVPVWLIRFWLTADNEQQFGAGQA
jgi:hypothetical protein